MTPSKKISKPKALTSCRKDGYGAHWHSVGWLAAIAVILSGSAMTLSASAATTPAITPAVLYRSVNDVKAQLNRIEAKIDRMGTQCSGAAAAAPATQCPTPSPNTPPPATEQAPPPSKTSGPTQAQCRQACEDEFNRCSASVGKDQMAYATCKNTYVSCWNGCEGLPQ